MPTRTGGNGSAQTPFGSIQDGLRAAQPGDTVIVLPGTYAESLRTVRAGREARPILVRAASPGRVLVTTRGRVLTVAHAYHTFEGLVLDGQYGMSDTVRVTSDGSYLTLRGVEVRRSSRDLIDMAAPRGVTIEGGLLHRALNWQDGRVDAHGIAAGAVRDLIVRDTEIHTFSGDAIQIDPDRAAPGWGGVVIERCRFWLAPLAEAENGFEAGMVPGENAIDTKAAAGLARATMAIRDTTAWGFRGGLIANMAAFNIKEHVDVVIDGVTVFDSEIAFRLRGAASRERGGAWVAVQNAVVYDVDVAFRYEDDIENLRIWNSTLGRRVARPFRPAEAQGSRLDVRNLLILGFRRPTEASDDSNLLVDEQAFVGAGVDDYRLAPASLAIDAGEVIPEVLTDRTGVGRPQGARHDAGAHEALVP